MVSDMRWIVEHQAGVEELLGDEVKKKPHMLELELELYLFVQIYQVPNS